MKKSLLTVTVLMLTSLLILGACSKPIPKPTPPPTTEPTYAPPNTSAPAPTYVPPITTPPTLRPTPTPAVTVTATATPAPAYRPPTPSPTPTSGFVAPSPDSGKLGLATGGAKDIMNFRQNIRNNYLPLPTDITYEGLFYDYFFDTGQREAANELFSPSYSYAVTRDPFSRQTEYYLSVGLNSGLREKDFQRKKLNLVIVLDISGSMTANFNQYYYDRYGKKRDVYAEEGVSRLRKMDSAKDAVLTILDRLYSDDRFAVVLFHSDALLAKPMGLVRQTDMKTIKNKILDITASGSTNLSAGIELGTRQFNDLYEIDNYEYENRIMVLTDAQPNTGDFSSYGLMNQVRRNADGRIYTTFIGIGVDFNTQLIEEITKIKGANYYAVHSSGEFRERTDEEFDFMVTPLVFNLRLNFESEGWRIEKVFGSPEANQATGELMRINTMFPSKSVGGETKGGLVLLKLRKTSSRPAEKVFLRVSYEDRNGRREGSEAVVLLEETQPEYFANSGIRKGVLLARYASLLKNWMIDERQHINYSRPWEPSVREDTGIVLPPEHISQWERQSLPLAVSEPYRRIFRDFSRYFEAEMKAINDYSLEQELTVLNRLSR